MVEPESLREYRYEPEMYVARPVFQSRFLYDTVRYHSQWIGTGQCSGRLTSMLAVKLNVVGVELQDDNAFQSRRHRNVLLGAQLGALASIEQHWCGMCLEACIKQTIPPGVTWLVKQSNASELRSTDARQVTS